MSPDADPHRMSDLGRRVAARRTELGLSRADVAARTGSTQGYIERLEEQLPMPGTAFLVRLANGGEILMLTAADAPLAQAAEADETIAFEEGRVDEAFHQGWSVLVGGPARTVQDRAAADELRRSVHSTPWSGENRDTFVLLTPRRVTGRRVLVEGAPGVQPPS
ncbi:helix-turn-helix domain-containing protein [Streptomyces cavernicola]|uniref:Helix-turn-helix transcriptional regulator n=1 Tax=Streptomyces cavernicola TaxID=3043613 RepID=A0ABT6SFD1_9ACTN|nr:helix-turn-helix transcriptional regulator [Streptomyces sp. B-S-A6]MDI3406870.1 helix-turn-helix transcriptional regulator [Streptomyces sp. B-S-A6]